MATYTIPADSYGGRLRPLGVVIHSAETPLRAGFAVSLARHWFGPGGGASTSAHGMVDPVDTVRMVDDDVVAYHCGRRGNGLFVGWEQAGYAHYPRDVWLDEDGMAQLLRLADVVRDACDRWGIPARWASDAQIRAAADRGVPAGLLTHDDVRRVLGGTTHTDPMPNYPRDVLLEHVVSPAVVTAPAAPKEPAMFIASVVGTDAEFLVTPTAVTHLSALERTAATGVLPRRSWNKAQLDAWRAVVARVRAELAEEIGSGTSTP